MSLSVGTERTQCDMAITGKATSNSSRSASGSALQTKHPQNRPQRLEKALFACLQTHSLII